MEITKKKVTEEYIFSDNTGVRTNTKEVVKWFVRADAFSFTANFKDHSLYDNAFPPDLTIEVSSPNWNITFSIDNNNSDINVPTYTHSASPFLPNKKQLDKFTDHLYDVATFWHVKNAWATDDTGKMLMLHEIAHLIELILFT